MSKKTIILLLILVVVGAAVWYFSSNRQTYSTITGPDSEFQVADTAAVDKIFIAKKDGTNYTLTREGGNRWLINGKYPARPAMVAMLLETLNRMQMKRPVSKTERGNVIRTLGARGIKVEVYKNDQIAKTFYVGGTTNDELGTFFLMEGSKDPYVVHIPGFNGFLDVRFDLKLTDWRQVLLFNVAPKNIEQLKVEYPKAPEDGFTINRTASGFEVAEVPQAEEENLRNYVLQYGRVFGDRYIEDPQNQLRDSLNMITPSAIIDLKASEKEKSNTLKLYMIPENKVNMLGVESRTNEVLLVESLAFEQLLVERKYFSEKSSQ